MMDFFSKEARRLCAIPADVGIDVLKFNTPGSIHGLYAKVIFLAFQTGACEPFACIKTVRKASDNFLIENAHDHLSALNTAIKGTECENMFPKALHKGEHDGIAYSLETAAKGRRYAKTEFNLVVETISRFQACVAQMPEKRLPYSEVLHRVAAAFGDWAPRIIEYGMKLPGHEDQIRMIPQHGDITPDNIFIRNGTVEIFDCEHYGVHDITGFDLYHFLLRRGLSRMNDFKKVIDPVFLKMEEKQLTSAHYFLLYVTDISIKSSYVRESMKVEDIIHRFQ